MLIIGILHLAITQKENYSLYPARLTPGQDVLTEILRITKYYGLRAVNLVSAVGSVHGCFIRFSNQSSSTFVNGTQEVVSLSGTIDQHSIPHIHISLSDRSGQTVGGHLPGVGQAGKCFVFTTLQLLMIENKQVAYRRDFDPATGYDQLTIYKRISSKEI